MTMRKKPVQFKPFKRTTFAFQKLTYCRRCGTFSILKEQVCSVCHKKTPIPVERQAELVAAKSLRIDALIAVFLFLAGVLLARTSVESIAMILCGLILLTLLFLFQRKWRKSFFLFHLDNMFHKQLPQIKAGLLRNSQSIIRDRDAGQERIAYEKLREIGTLLRSDPIRKLKLIFLNQFYLRKDMDLEMDSLIMREFDPDLVDYIGTIARIRKDLIKKRTLRYVTRYQIEIAKLPGGENILIDVAGCALRTKPYIDQFRSLIIGQMRKLPKERFLRLCKMLHQREGYDWDDLYARAQAVCEEQYHWDPDFSKFF